MKREEQTVPVRKPAKGNRRRQTTAKGQATAEARAAERPENTAGATKDYNNG